jgi:hypothetical protein
VEVTDTHKQWWTIIKSASSKVLVDLVALVLRIHDGPASNPSPETFIVTDVCGFIQDLQTTSDFLYFPIY